MFTINAYVHTVAQTIQPAIVREELENGVTAVYAEAVTDTAIQGDLGVELSLIPNIPVVRYMADYRRTQYWCMPFFGSALADIPDDTQALVLELEGGQYAVLVPVVNDAYKCVLHGGDGCIRATVSSWQEGLNRCEGLAFVYALGSSPAQLMQSCVRAAVKLLGNKILLRQEREYPGIFEYLGWCSWDSMQIRVNEADIEEKCREFRDKGIPVKWAILDDMWAEIRDFYGKTYENSSEMVEMMHASRMYGLEADPIRFPNGLAHCVKTVKDYGIHMGIWFPTTGYWAGMDPEGPACRYFEKHLIRSKLEQLIPNWEYDHAYVYFTKAMEFFRSCGAEFVKIDNQAVFLRQYKGFAPIGQMAEEFHNGLENAAKEQFNSRMINCMGMAAENIWKRSASPISRCSDDFLPENRTWFTKHVLQCSYNSLLQGQLYWCDWDMWWTDDGQAKKNSLMRAVSGGPVYVSDKLQRSRKEILEPLMQHDGRLLRCDRPAVPTDDCVTVDPTSSGKALKLQNIAGQHGVLAVLNLDAEERPVTTVISADQIAGLKDQTYAVYEHFSGQCQILQPGESFQVTLQNSDDYRLYIFAPVQDGFAVIGRTDKFISPKTIASVVGEQVTLTEFGPWAYVRDGILHRMKS